MSETREWVDLLVTARETLQRDIVPALPAEQRYGAAMIANALAIAARGLAADPAPDDLSALHEDAASDVPRDILERRLVADIRAGRFDGDDAGRLRAVLLKRTIERLKISDPEALAASGPG